VTSNKNSADGLSRLPADKEREPYQRISYLHYVDEMKIINAKLIQKETNKDPILSKVKYYITNG